MSTERHLSRKRPGVTIDAEAQSQSLEESQKAGMAAEPAQTPTDTISSPIANPVLDETPLLDRPFTQEPAKAEAAPRKSSSSGFIGGFVGSALALAGFIGLDAVGFLPTQNNADSTLSDRLAALEANIASGTSSEGESVAALSAEVTALKDSIAALSQAAANSSVEGRVTALEQAIPPAAPANNSADMNALASRIATLESKAAETSAGGAISGEALTTMRNALATEINGLKSNLAALKTEITERGSEPGLAAAVAASALRSAVDRGGAFAAELENFAAVAPDAPAIAALRNFAASGVPTRQDITAEFEAAAQAMLAASAPVDPDAGLFDQLLDSAKSLVKVRPIGDVEGDTASARIARIGQALANSDDAAVTTEFAALPAASRTAGADFMARFSARAEADRLMAEAVRAAAPKAGG